MERFIQALMAGRMKNVPILATLAVIIVSKLLTDTNGSLEYSSYSYYVAEDDSSTHGTTVSLCKNPLPRCASTFCMFFRQTLVCNCIG